MRRAAKLAVLGLAGLLHQRHPAVRKAVNFSIIKQEHGLVCREIGKIGGAGLIALALVSSSGGWVGSSTRR